MDFFNFNTSELYCVEVVNCRPIVFSLFFFFLFCQLYCFVWLSVCVCPFAAVMANKIYYCIGTDSADSRRFNWFSN